MSLTALFTGSSGLAANSSALDVVGNNLANINTSGYKTQRTGFKDLVYQSLSSGSAASANVGGTDPIQVGFGVGVSDVSSLFQQGALNPTGRSLDAGIQGDGFFVVSNGSQTQYTRAGAFSVDSAGFLVDPNTGFRVQRFGTVGEGSPAAPGFQTPGNQDIRVPFGAGLTGTPTSTADLQGNITSTLAVGQSVTTAIQVFDSQSTQRSLTVTFTKTAANTYSASAAVSGGTATIPAGTSLTFDNNGLLQSPATIPVAISGIPGTAAQTVTLNLGTPGQSTGLTQFGGVTTAAATNQNGNASGTLTSVSYDQDGTVEGVFSNGKTIAIAQLAIAGFNNEGGLIRTGNNYFSGSAASGGALIGIAGQGGRGAIQGGSLEGSNVDIATEFSRLIIAQRGFEVNARTITAANETLQDLNNIIH